MSQIKRYLNIYSIHLQTGLAKDIGFRFSFVMAFAGSLIFIVLHFSVIYLVFQKFQIGKWTIKEMWILFGSFLIIYYGFFFLFWRGLIKMIRSIRDGKFDFTLLKPIDLQFTTALLGGGIHNLIAILFGIVIIVFGLSNLNIAFNGLTIVSTVLVYLLGILDVYTLILILATLNFKYGYIEEVLNFILGFQDFSRYPMDAYSRLPLHMLLVAIPFSALSTIPTIILINPIFPINEMLIFTAVSVEFIFLGRYILFKAVRNYASGS